MPILFEIQEAQIKRSRRKLKNMNPYKQIEQEILASSHIVITAHKSPDGDSIGSSLGLYQFIKKLVKMQSISSSHAK